MTPERVLLVTHEATRSGAPRVAAEIARVLRARGYEVVIVLRLGGPLRPEFDRVSDRVVREPFTRLRVVLRYFRRTRKLAVRLEQHAARRVLRRERPAIAYLNSVKSACYVRPAVEVGLPVVLHVHEVEPLASSTLGRYSLGSLLGRVHLVACSDIAQRNLASLTGLDPTVIDLVVSAIDVDEIVANAGVKLRDVVSLSADALVVGACGKADPGKGVDLWLEIASRIRRARPDLPVRFLWVGRADVKELRAEARRLGIDAVVEFAGDVANPYPLIAAMDVMTVPSRVGAFPLVVLEAMALGRPVVAFSVPAMVSQIGDAGVLVPEGDAQAMAAAVLDLLERADCRQELGIRAAERMRTQFRIENFRGAVASVVAGALAQGRREGPGAPR